MDLTESPDDTVLVEFTITFPSPEYARIAALSVDVDKDIRPGRLERIITYTDCDVNVTIKGSDKKAVRVFSAATLDMLQLSAKTMASFSPP